MPVTFETYEDAALRTLGPHNDLLYLTIGLVGEVGEVIDYAKKTLYHGHKYEADKFSEEIGDVCWYVAAICHNQGIYFSDVVSWPGPELGFSKEEIVLDPEKILNLASLSSPTVIKEHIENGTIQGPLVRLMRELKSVVLDAHLKLEDILNQNIQKLEKRYPNGYSDTSSIKRVDYAK